MVVLQLIIFCAWLELAARWLLGITLGWRFRLQFAVLFGFMMIVSDLLLWPYLLMSHDLVLGGHHVSEALNAAIAMLTPVPVGIAAFKLVELDRSVQRLLNWTTTAKLMAIAIAAGTATLHVISALARLLAGLAAT